MKKKGHYDEADCQLCGTFHKFDPPVKKFVCTKCGVGQNITVPLTARQSVGNNHNGHELPPGTSHR